MAEGSGERATGTPNTIYDLSSVLFHSLEGGASYDQYIRDAEAASDEELVDFFTRVRDEDSRRADEAQTLLAERTPTPARAQEGASSGMAPTTEEARPPRQGMDEQSERAREEEDEGLLNRVTDRAGEALRGQDSLAVPREEETREPRRESPRGPRGDEPL